MLISQGVKAIPWEFDNVEADQLRTLFALPLVQAYLGSLKSLALENKLADPDADALGVAQSNAYMAGQEYILDGLLASPLYVPLIPTTGDR